MKKRTSLDDNNLEDRIFDKITRTYLLYTQDKTKCQAMLDAFFDKDPNKYKVLSHHFETFFKTGHINQIMYNKVHASVDGTPFTIFAETKQELLNYIKGKISFSLLD